MHNAVLATLAIQRLTQPQSVWRSGDAPEQRGVVSVLDNHVPSEAKLNLETCIIVMVQAAGNRVVKHGYLITSQAINIARGLPRSVKMSKGQCTSITPLSANSSIDSIVVPML